MSDTFKEIMTALNVFENTLRRAVRTDTVAEYAGAWEARKLKACEVAWAEYKAARVELEAKIKEAIERGSHVP